MTTITERTVGKTPKPVKMRIVVNLEIHHTQFAALAKVAALAGCDFDSTTTRKYVRRYLEEQVTNAVIYAHEHVEQCD